MKLILTVIRWRGLGQGSLVVHASQRLRPAVHGGCESLDAFAGRIGGTAARYAGHGTMLDDAAMVKKMLNTVSDCLYATVEGIK